MLFLVDAMLFPVKLGRVGTKILFVLLTVYQPMLAENANTSVALCCPDSRWTLLHNPLRCMIAIRLATDNVTRQRFHCKARATFFTQFTVDLATVHTKESQKAICSKLKVDQEIRYAIGIHKDLHSGKFQWVHSNTLVKKNESNWANGKQTSFGCAYMRKDVDLRCFWYGIDCSVPVEQTVCQTYGMLPCEPGAYWDRHSDTMRKGESVCDEKCANNFICRYRSNKGKAECVCLPGFELQSNTNNTVCKDIDECALNEDLGCEQNCINTVGSFRCECQQPNFFSQYTINGTECVCLKGFQRVRVHSDNNANENNNRNAMDIDRNSSSSTTNDGGDSISNKNAAAKSKSIVKFKCADIDECAVENGHCGKGRLCRNLPGGFDCCGSTSTNPHPCEARDTGKGLGEIIFPDSKTTLTPWVVVGFLIVFITLIGIACFVVSRRKTGEDVNPTEEQID